MLAFSGRLGKYLAAADLCGRSLDCFSPYEWIRTRGTDCLAFQGGLLTAYEVAWQFEFISLRQAMGQPGGSRPRWRRTARSEAQKRKSPLSRIRLLVARPLCCLMTATVVVDHHRGGDRAQAQGGDHPHGLAPNRHWCLSKYCSHAAERILAACSMLP